MHIIAFDRCADTISLKEARKIKSPTDPPWHDVLVKPVYVSAHMAGQGHTLCPSCLKNFKKFMKKQD